MNGATGEYRCDFISAGVCPDQIIVTSLIKVSSQDIGMFNGLYWI